VPGLLGGAGPALNQRQTPVGFDFTVSAEMNGREEAWAIRSALSGIYMFCSRAVYLNWISSNYDGVFRLNCRHTYN